MVNNNNSNIIAITLEKVAKINNNKENNDKNQYFTQPNSIRFIFRIKNLLKKLSIKD